jgi:tetratricopeptide (TPR) repeat protein
VTRFLLTAVLTAACTLPCAAQTKEVVEEVGAKLTDLRVAARHADERNEDVEILRRLLNKSLGFPDRQMYLPDPPVSYLVSPSATSGITHGERVSQAVGPFDGVYLKGAGVVYTLRIPAGADLTFDPHTQRVGVNAGCTKCHRGITPNANAHYISFSHSEYRGGCTSCHSGDLPTTAAKPLTEWEQARLALRGDKPKEPEPVKEGKPRGVLCDPGSLAEQLTAQLSAHARNVRHLGEKESITVVVTFDDLPGPKAAGSPAKLGLTPDEVQALTLGDLHLKQGKHAQAVEEYLKGLVRFRDTVRLSAPANTPYKDVTAALEEMTGGIRAAYKSLAAAYLHLGHLEDAKQALEKATAVRVELGTGSTGDTPKAVGPAKLILSVAKADAAAKDVAAFKKVLAVERVNFPPAEVKKTK